VKVHSAIAATLAGQGVSVIFGVLGDGNMFFVDCFVREQGGKYVSSCNEAGAVLMASAYASASGGAGVATVTHGPGLANALAALISGAREHAPIVLIAGDTGANARGHSQKIDQASLVLPTGAGFECARSAKTVIEDLARAFRRAVTERRPIVFDVSIDLMFLEVDAVDTHRPAAPSNSAGPDVGAMDAAVGVIASARRPMVLAGAGAISPGSAMALRRLAERIGALTSTTIPAKGLFGREAFDVGVFGSLSSPAAAEAIGASDCIIAVGASLNRLTGGGDGWPFLKGKRVIQCDNDVAALGREYPADVLVCADAAAFADLAVEWLDEAEYVGTNFRSTAFAKAVGDPAPPKLSARDDCVDLSLALRYLNRALPEDRSITADGGRFTSNAVQLLDVPNPRAWSFSGRGFGAVGNGVATAIGLGLAIPGAPSVAVVGDGGFMLGGLAEFNTAVRHGIDLIVVVCNDGSYGAEYRKLISRDFPTDTSMFDWPDFAPVAVALGGAGVTVSCEDDLTKLDDVIAHRDRPLLIDVKLDPSVGSLEH
jgi:thiamine pyrophosphate-dependent acetolactate synthase large subunit-like protein